MQVLPSGGRLARISPVACLFVILGVAAALPGESGENLVPEFPDHPAALGSGSLQTSAVDSAMAASDIPGAPAVEVLGILLTPSVVSHTGSQLLDEGQPFSSCKFLVDQAAQRGIRYVLVAKPAGAPCWSEFGSLGSFADVGEAAGYAFDRGVEIVLVVGREDFPSGDQKVLEDLAAWNVSGILCESSCWMDEVSHSTRDSLAVEASRRNLRCGFSDQDRPSATACGAGRVFSEVIAFVPPAETRPDAEGSRDAAAPRD